MKKLTTDLFIKRAKKIHGDLYNYSKTKYQLSNKHVIITCSLHGDFKQRPNDHTGKGQGCPQCAKINSANKRRVATGMFIQRAKEVHGNHYDYKKVVYLTTHTKVIITCPVHGDFFQKPNTHVSGRSGCSRCSYNRHPGRYVEEYFQRRGKKEPGIFYVIKFYNATEKFIKIGITKNNTQKRFVGKHKHYKMEILSEQKTTLYKAFKKEKILLQKLKEYTYKPKKLLEGHTECFKLNCLDLII